MRVARAQAFGRVAAAERAIRRGLHRGIAAAFALLRGERDDLRDISLMMVTTESEQGQIVRALAAGAHEYVIKPFTTEIIEDKLAMLGLL